MSNTNFDDIAQRIDARRKELGYSYQDLANATGLSKSTLQRYVTGAIKNIPLARLDLLADGLHTTASYLLGWDNDPNDYDDPDYTNDIPLDIMHEFAGNPKQQYEVQRAMERDNSNAVIGAAAHLDTNDPEAIEEYNKLVEYLNFKYSKKD